MRKAVTKRYEVDTTTPLPAVRSQEEVRALLAAQIIKTALDELALITRQISELNPSDPETYALMLRLREAYVWNIEERIVRRFG